MKPKEKERFLVDWINIVQNGIIFVEKVGVMLIPSVACGVQKVMIMIVQLPTRGVLVVRNVIMMEIWYRRQLL